MIRQFAVLLLLTLAANTFAAVDTFDFDSQMQRDRFYRLSSELRCPKCQNQNIADSDAPIAMDLRREVYRMVMEGKDDDQVIDFMVSRYGDFVRYKPALTPATAVLWFAPAGLLVGGLLVLAVMLRRRQRALRDTSTQHLSQDEQQRLQSLLEREEDS